MVEEFYTINLGVKKGLSGFRILSMDESRFTLLKTKEFGKIYGDSKNQSLSYAIQGRACVLFDLLNKICISGVFSSIGTDERKQAKQLLDYCEKKTT